VHLSPDEIERRAFAIEDRGYDRDEVRVFLLEVASALRLALHTTRPPSVSPPAATELAPPTVTTPTSADDFARLGTEVAEVLRSAHEAVAALHQQAEVDIAARHDEALADAEEVRRQADNDATWTHDRAKRVLITAQEQADAIVAEAEANAAELLTNARRQARDHADQVATRTRRHAEQILRAEREALRRLHQAQAGVAAAVEMLTGSETRPVVDLTELRPNVRLGPLSLEAPDPDPSPAESVNDPVARMIRNAVDRASQHAQGSGTTESTDPDRGPRGDAAGRTAVATPPASAPAAPVAPVRVVRPTPRTEPDGSASVVATSNLPAAHGSPAVSASGSSAAARVDPPTVGADDRRPRPAR
jgi:DivIVA domain-containing protein